MLAEHPARVLGRVLAREPRRALVLAVLMVLVAVTEGVGVLVLVPTLDLMGGGSGISWGSSRLQASAGLIGSLPTLLALFVLLVALRAGLQYAQQVAGAKLQQVIVDGLRRQVFASLLGAEWRWLARERATDHVSSLMTNMARIGVGLNSALSTVAGVVTAVGGIAAAFALSWHAALGVAVGAGLVGPASAGLRVRAVRLGEALGRANRALQAVVQDGLTGVRLTKIHGQEELQIERLSGALAAVRAQQLRFVASSAANRATIQVSSAAVLACILYVGVAWWQMPLAHLLPLVLVFARVLPSLGGIQRGWHQWLHAVSAWRETEALLAAGAENAEPGAMDPGPPWQVAEAVELDQVTVTYGGRSTPALVDVSIRFPAHTTTAVLGPSGAGKSTLADVLMGLLEPDSGALRVDRAAVTGSARRRWRGSVAYVPQDAFLFHDSVRANLLWAAPHASEQALHDALALAAAGFVAALPEGIDTIVGDGGVLLSGGERQRIALARALLDRPQLLILDEATSALDPENEAAIRCAIGALHGNLTVVVIGHRLAMLDHADQVIRLEAGRCVSAGPPPRRRLVA